MRLPRFHYILRAALVAPFFVASIPAGAEQGAADAKPPAKTEAPPANTTCGPPIMSNVPAQPAALSQEQASFALELLSAVAADGKGNVAVSPFGVSAVLGVLDIGADAKMKAAIAHTLRIGEKGEKIDLLRKNVRLLAVMAAKQNSSFASADALFVDHSLPLKPGIEDQVQAEGGIKLEKLDFASPDAIAEVNSWVAKHTRDRIKSILEPGSSPALVAVNAFAFKDCWRVPFDPAATAAKPFHRLDGSTADRPTMALDNYEFAYGTKGRFVALELPYADERFALTLVTTRDAPAAPSIFKDAGDLLTGTGFKQTMTRVELPKFTGTGDYDLLAILLKLGLEQGLKSNTAFSGFAEGIKLSAVRQKTFVAVDEVGTEAAAATAATMERGLSPQPAATPVSFDKPFVYVLRHRATGTILMMGYVADPTIASN